MEETKPQKQYSQLSGQERAVIEVMLDQRCKLRAIAQSLQRAPSTISREIARNTRDAPVRALSGAAAANAYVDSKRRDKPYCSLRAQARAARLSNLPRCAKKLYPAAPSWSPLIECLQKGLSPKQASSTLARMNQAQLSHETIYKTLYAMPRGELRSEILNLLPWGRKSRRSRGGGQDRRRGIILDMTSIEERPIEVEDRLIPGHWEGDLIKGAGNKSQIGTLVERSTMFVVLVKVERATAAKTADAFIGVLNRIDAQMRLSLTYDQGVEMAHHAHLSRQTGMQVYFAHPHSPWERGSNENMNGQLRRYFPKGSDLSKFSQTELDEIAMHMNAKPRAALGGKCPAELFLPPGTFDFNAYWAKQLNLETVALGG